MTDVYLDVDGVINVLGTPPDVWPEWETAKVSGSTVSYAPSLIAALNDLADRPDTDFHWLTTWEEDALALTQIGLHCADWPVLGIHEHRHEEPLKANGGWWKLAAVQTYWPSRDRPAVWVDDDLNYDNETATYVRDSPLLWGVCPRSVRGLIPADLGNLYALLIGAPAHAARAAAD